MNQGPFGKAFTKPSIGFKTAFFGAKQRLIYARKLGGVAKPLLPSSSKPVPRELIEGEKNSILIRDGNKCLACGAHGKGVRLQIDHIVPVKFGGQTDADNSQTLCSVCNGQKAINAINFRNYHTLLPSPKVLDFPKGNHAEDVNRSITRLVNFFYHCQAVCRVTLHKRRSGRCYSCWEIELYSGNNPDWLVEHKQVLLKYIREDLGWDHVTDLKIIGTGG